MLEGSALHFSSGDEAGEEEVLHLKQLQELSEYLTDLYDGCFGKSFLFLQCQTRRKNKVSCLIKNV